VDLARVLDKINILKLNRFKIGYSEADTKAKLITPKLKESCLDILG